MLVVRVKLEYYHTKLMFWARVINVNRAYARVAIQIAQIMFANVNSNIHWVNYVIANMGFRYYY